LYCHYRIPIQIIGAITANKGSIMNAKRVVLGGLVAGLIINVGETILNVPVIGAEFDAVIQRLGLPAMSGATIGLFVLMCFGLGIMCTWLYAAIRPHFGEGPRTALIASSFVWLLVSLWGNVTSAAMGILPVRLLAITLVWQAIEIPLATLAGAYLYREEQDRVVELERAIH
jgi:hypothetical protein